MSSTKTPHQTEIIFLVETHPEGVYTACALGPPSYTMADNLAVGSTFSINKKSAF